MKKALLLAVLAVSSSAQGKSIAPFDLPVMNPGYENRTYRSQDHARSVFILEAYFRRCPYCNDNAPLIKQAWQRYQNNDRVQFLDIGRDCRESDYEAWIDEHKPGHLVLNDCNRKVLSQLEVVGFPTTYVLDCKLNIIWEHVGLLYPSSQERLHTVIESELRNPECM